MKFKRKKALYCDLKSLIIVVVNCNDLKNINSTVLLN